MKWFALSLLLIFAPSARALDPFCSLLGGLIGGQDSKNTFLGVISFNPNQHEAIINKYGPHGSEFETASIFNKFGTFGGEFSSYSPYNKFSTTPPFIFFLDDDDELVLVALLTKNKYAPNPSGYTGALLPVVDPDDIMGFLKFGDCTGGGTVGITKRATKPKRTPASRGVNLLGRKR